MQYNTLTDNLCFVHVEYSSKINSVVGNSKAYGPITLGLAITDSEKNENIYLNLKVSVALLSSLHCL